MQDVNEETIADALARARAAYDARDFPAARAALEDSARGDDSGESQALLGLACFQAGDYEVAVTHLNAALDRRPENAAWRAVLTRVPGPDPLAEGEHQLSHALAGDGRHHPERAREQR